MAFHFNKLESSSPKKVLLKYTQWFWRRSFYKISLLYYLNFIIISPWKKRGSSFEQTWILLPKDALWQVLLKLALGFWRRRWKCEKFKTTLTTMMPTTTTMTTTTTDNGQVLITKAHLCEVLHLNKLHPRILFPDDGQRTNWDQKMSL